MSDRRIEFRDGTRDVPDHLYDELVQLDTYRLTYDEALRLADKARQGRWLSDMQHKIVLDHFSEQRRGF